MNLAFGFICLSTIEIAGSMVMTIGASPATLLSARFWIATILLFITLLISKSSFKIKKEYIGIVIIQSVLLMAHTTAYWYGIKALNSVPTAISVHQIHAIWTAIISAVFLGEYFSRNRILAIILGIVGTLFIVGVLPSFNIVLNPIGIGFILLSSVMFSLLFIVSKKIMGKYNPLLLLFYNSLFISVVIMFIQNPYITLGQVSSKTLPYLLFLGVVSTYLLWFFYYNSLKYLRASEIGIFLPFRKIFSIILAYFVLSQTLSLFQWIGALIVISAGYFLEKEYRKPIL